MSILRALWHLLDRGNGHRLGLQLLSIVMALSTVGGVASVLPFFAALPDPTIPSSHNAVAWAVLQEAACGRRLDCSRPGSRLCIDGADGECDQSLWLAGNQPIFRPCWRKLYAELFAEYLVGVTIPSRAAVPCLRGECRRARA